MMKLKNILFTLAMLSVLGISWPYTWRSYPNSAAIGTNLWVKNEIRILESQTRGIDDNVLRLALTAYKNALKNGYVGKQVLTVIDYSKNSLTKRMWVFDMKNNRTLFNTWVSHGKNSGGFNSTSFSNTNGSLKSSVGVFQTESTYTGKNGYSLRLNGLERGINDAAYSRAIVVHGAAYANGNRVRTNTGLGRSWGCPAVDSSLAKPIINTIKDKSIIFAYGDDRRWLSGSRFLSA